ncbi:hypothetical protein [Exiguobacterium undae]
MLKNKFMLSLLGSTLIVSSIPGNVDAEQSVAKPSVMVQQQDGDVDSYSSTFESEGITYQMDVREDSDQRVITFKSNKGTEVFTRLKNSKKIKVTSDHLSKDETAEMEKSVNGISVQMADVDSEEQGSLVPYQGRAAIVNVQPMAQKGSWAWSNYQKITITASTKVTVQAVAGAIVAAIPYVGSIAVAMATVIVEYKMKKGYFKRKIGTKLDTDANYYWQQIRLELYKDSARTKLLKTKFTKPTRSLIMN